MYTHNSFTSCNDDLTSPKVSCTLCFNWPGRTQTDTEQLLALSDKLTGVLLPQTQNFRLSHKTLANNSKMTKDNHRIVANSHAILRFHLRCKKMIF